MMNWTPLFAGNQTSPFGAPTAEKPNEAQRRVLSDISNTRSGFGFQGGAEAQKLPLLDPQTPARRTTAFAVFEDSADTSAARNAGSPPQVRPKSRGAVEEDVLGGGRGIFAIDEVDAKAMEADLPGIDSFADPVDVQDQYWRALGMDGPDGFDSPQALASSLAQATARVCHEANSRDACRWGHSDPSISALDDMSPGDMSPGMPVAWPAAPASPPQARCSSSPMGDRGFASGSLFDAGAPLIGADGFGAPLIGADGFGACEGFGFGRQVKTAFSPLSLPHLPAIDLDVDMDSSGGSCKSHTAEDQSASVFGNMPSTAEPFAGFGRMAPTGRPPP